MAALHVGLLEAAGERPAKPNRKNAKKRQKLRERAEKAAAGLCDKDEGGSDEDAEPRDAGEGEERLPKRAVGKEEPKVQNQSRAEKRRAPDAGEGLGERAQANALPQDRSPKVLEAKKRTAQQPLAQPRPTAPVAHEAAQPGAAARPVSAVQKKLQAKLQGARFRQLNEQLYTTDSSTALALLRAEPELFTAYHDGFREQARRWPVNPLLGLIAWAKTLPADAVLGDFGCGEAQLAASVPQTVHSFDLVASNDRVVACDIAAVPLPDGALDGAVFCLALMGTNWADFLREAHRTLRVGGVLKIVEVRSRVADVADFVRTLRALGFDKRALDESNSHFLAIEAVKAARPPVEAVHPKPLAPCIYKRR